MLCFHKFTNIYTGQTLYCQMYWRDWSSSWWGLVHLYCMLCRKKLTCTVVNSDWPVPIHTQPISSLSRNAGLSVSFRNSWMPHTTMSAANLKWHINLYFNPVCLQVSTSGNLTQSLPLLLPFSSLAPEIVSPSHLWSSYISFPFRFVIKLFFLVVCCHLFFVYVPSNLFYIELIIIKIIINIKNTQLFSYFATSFLS